MNTKQLFGFVDQMIAVLKDRDDWQVMGARMQSVAASFLRERELRQRTAEGQTAEDEPLWRRIGDFCEPMMVAWSERLNEGAEALRERRLRAVVVFWVGLRAIPQEDAAQVLSQESVNAWASLLTEIGPVDLDVARQQHFTVPQLAAEALALVRTGRLAPGSPPQRVPRSVSQTFEVPPRWPDAGFWRLLPPRGAELMLPLDGQVVITKLGKSLREVLSGGVMRLWLATWVLAHEQGDPQGAFHINTRHVLCDLYNRKPESFKGPNDRRYERAPRALERDLWRHLEVLCSVYISGVGEVRAETPEPLILKYTRRDNNQEVYQHAPLAVRMAKMAFTQVPRAVLRLDPEDASTALGVANLWRLRITSVLRGSGEYERDLETLAAEVGEDSQAGMRRLGRAWWGEFADRLARVMNAGELGTFQVDGQEPTSRVRLAPSEALAMVYRPLCEASDRQRDLAQRVELEDALRARCPPRQGRGRPRRSGR